jgi:hypothetical protein
MSENSRHDFSTRDSQKIVRLSHEADIQQTTKLQKVPISKESVYEYLNQKVDLGIGVENAKEMLDLFSRIPMRDPESSIESYKLIFALDHLPYILRESLQTETISGQSFLGEFFSDPNMWEAVYRISQFWGSDRNLWQTLETKRFEPLDFFSWMHEDSKGADLLTRDLRFMIDTGVISDPGESARFDERFSKTVREKVFWESKKLVSEIEDASAQVFPLLEKKIQEVSGDISWEETLSRVQFVSQDRGGRLLLYGLLKEDKFKNVLSAWPASAFFGIKIETSRIAYSSSNPQEGYDVDQFEKLRESLEFSGKDILILIDLYGGREGEKKQTALKNLFSRASSRELQIITVGISDLNDAGLGFHPLSFYDDQSRAMGTSFQSGRVEIPYSIPPYPWKWLLHKGGENRLREYLELDISSLNNWPDERER